MKTSLVIFSLLLMGFLPQAQDQAQEAEQRYQEALFQMEGLGNFPAAIEKFEKLAADFPENKPLAARALLMVGRCHEKLGRAEAVNAYNRIIEQYGDQLEAVTEARARLLALAEEAPGFTIRKVRPVPIQGLGKVSPDRQYRTFSDWTTGNLAIEDLITGEQRLLTDKLARLDSGDMAFFSRWSPDGKHIVFDWWSWDELSSAEIWLVEPDGTNLRFLFQAEDPKNTSTFTYDWSPDGKDILAATVQNGVGSMILISVSDGSARTIKEFDFKRFRTDEMNNMLFSPCGEYIIYDFPEEGSKNINIFTLSLEDLSESPLVEHPANDLLLEWTPDGRYVLFLSDRRGSLDIWRLPMTEDRATGPPELVKEGVGMIQSQGFTADGAFYYLSDKNTWNVYIAKLDSESGKITEPPSHPITYLGTSIFSPAYSPDGRYLAYISHRGPKGSQQTVICIRSLENGEERTIFPGYFFETLQWSPDNQSLIGLARDTRDKRAYDMIARVDMETEEVFRVFRCEHDRFRDRVRQPVWSHDGTTIFYVFTDAYIRSSIVSRDLNTGMETELYSFPESGFQMGRSLSRSPDGQWLTVITGADEKTMKIIPSSGGEPRELYTFIQPANMRSSTVWSSDNKSIIFVKFQDQGDLPYGMAEFLRISVDGGEPEKLGLTMYRVCSLSMHPDGQQLAIRSLGQKVSESELWVMERFLPEE